MSTTSIASASPAAVSGRSDHGQALTSVSTGASSALAFSMREALIAAVSSGFSIGSPPPPPEQYDHWVTRSTSSNVSPGIERRISRGSAQMPLRLLSRHGSWYVIVRSTGTLGVSRPSRISSANSSTTSTTSMS
ncbi:hypothetical protein GCM10025872_01730 [Barrientosiimonas endolithica]|uniref:Uncharacterized protein n=1 Tax=Barrientosiimonas endolithica TaxID=1535208 RepID=A0ABM8H6X6_9MICO|nr:hypothetical protein [Barrientosiimonas endolithica]BDZ56516.1 hypothetical protein GCM10025872_01730 [Barrientosiimonas endolithica]